MKIISWNVNGLRSILKKGFGEFVESYNPDILCLQEIKIGREQPIPEELRQLGYELVVSAAEKKGYSGVLTFVKEGTPFSAKKSKLGINIAEFDSEGRFAITEHEDFLLYNVYIPSGTTGELRQQFKYDFLEHFLKHLKKLSQGKRKRLVICGDFNICHRSIDIHHPDVATKRQLSGFLPEEREWLDLFIDSGFVDTFRLINGDKKDIYSWWSYRAGSRGKNLGWRIDYLFVAKELSKKVVDASIETSINGSDHCPVTLTLDL